MCSKNYGNLETKTKYEFSVIHLIKSVEINKQNFKPNSLIQDLQSPEFNIQSIVQLN